MHLFRTKPVQRLGDDAPEGIATEQVGHLRKRLSVRHGFGFGFGVVIGTGIFTLTGVAARDIAGSAVVVSFAVAGVVALPAALCYAEPASSA